MDSANEEATSSEEDSKNSERSLDESDAPQPPRRSHGQQLARTKVSQDKMKDARELFTWTAEQKSRAIRLWDALDGGERGTQMDALLESISLFIFTQYHPEALSTGLM